MKEAKKEAKRWLLQAEDDLRFVEWLEKEGLFLIRAVLCHSRPERKP